MSDNEQSTVVFEEFYDEDYSSTEEYDVEDEYFEEEDLDVLVEESEKVVIEERVKNPWDKPEDEEEEDLYPWGYTMNERISVMKEILNKNTPFNSVEKEMINEFCHKNLY